VKNLIVARSVSSEARNVLLDLPVSAHLPLAVSALQSLQNAVAVAVSPPAQITADTFQSVKLVLDSLQLLGAGAKGGYFYNIYINLPPTGDAGNGRRYFLGTVAPFEIAGASHHGPATLEFPATEVLSQLSASELQDVTISFVRVNGENPARGAVLRIGEVRIEVSTYAPWDRSTPATRLPNQCYC
jgi:tyrosinase